MTAGLLLAGTLRARPQEGAIIKVPFAFSVGSQRLPAGAYQIELMTHAQAGKDRIEVVVLRGLDRQAYASFVSRLVVVEDQAATPGLTFRRAQGQEFLTELRVHGKRLRPAMPNTQVAGEADLALMAEPGTSGR